MNNLWAFLPMEPANELLGDPAALRAQLDRDGYLYLQRIIDRDRVRDLRRRMLAVLAEHGWIAGGDAQYLAFVERPAVREGDDAFFEVYDDIQRLEAFHSLAHSEELLALMRAVLDDTAFPHPLKVARLIFPWSHEISTPPHQDHPNNQGTIDLIAAWIPVGDCPTELGSLAVLRGSNHFGVLPRDFHLGPGNRHALLPAELRERLHWVTADFEMGDVVLFPSLTVHASLHNATEVRMRLSVDFRYQREGEELTDLVLQPHFQRLSWEQIYAGWESEELQHYWKDLDVTVVPYDGARYDAAGEPTREQVRAARHFGLRAEGRFRAYGGGTGADDDERR